MPARWNERLPAMARLYVNPAMRYLAERNELANLGLRRLETAAIDWLWSTTANRSVQQASDAGGKLGALIGPRLRKNKHVLRNLEVIFPQDTPKVIRARAKGVWRQIGRTLAEYPHIQKLTDPAQDHFEFVNHTNLADLSSPNVGHILVGMHQANWNLHGMAGSLADIPLDLIYAEQKDPHLERRIAAHRVWIRAGFIHVGDVPRKMIERLKAGRHVGLFVDHRIDNGEPVSFFGKPANTTIIPARVAVKLGTGLIPVQLERLPHCRFRLTLHAPIAADPGITDERGAAMDMMERLHRQFERWVIARPEDWCCIKRRWVKAPSRTEQIGIFGRRVEWRGVE